MTNATVWARRVKEWRASGKSSVEFAAGKGFTGGGLRHWAYRLKLEEEAASSTSPGAPAEPRSKRTASPPKPQRKAVRVARVIRTSPGAPPVSARVDGSIVFDFAGTRVAVQADYDRAALRDLLALLGEAGEPLVRQGLR